MLYAVLCYNSEEVVGAWSKEQDDATMAQLQAVEDRIAAAGKLGPVARLMPTRTATTLRKRQGSAPLIVDGPFAETKEQFLGFFVIDCGNLDEAIAHTRDLAEANPGTGAYEIRPLQIFHPGVGLS
ncbi:MAG TPA: YciI family protein [Devosiaceae bacterium]|jgi:hypothetical protein